MGTFLPQSPQKKDSKEKKVVTPKSDLKSLKTLEPHQGIQNHKSKHMAFHLSLLVLMITPLYLLPVTHTLHTNHDGEPVLRYGSQDKIDQGSHLFCTPVSHWDREKFSNERNLQNVRVLKSATPFKTTDNIRKTAKQSLFKQREQCCLSQDIILPRCKQSREPINYIRNFEVKREMSCTL